MKYRVDRKHLFFVFLFYTFLFNEPLASIIPFWGYEDELIAICAVPIFLFVYYRKNSKKISLGVLPYITCFVVCGVLGSLIYSYQDFFRTALPDILICIKFWLCLYFGMQVFKNYDLNKYSYRISLHIKMVAWLFFFLSILNYSFGMFSFYDHRYGIGANSLFYSHPSVLISHCSFLIILILGILPKFKHPLFYIIIISITMCTSLRSKALANAMIFAIIYFFVVVKKEGFSAKSLIPFAPLIIFIGWAQIEFYFISLGDTSARSQLLLKSFVVAKDHFPIGSGFGTYGSYYSAIHYSPLYYQYGLNRIYGMSEEFRSFICDSFWPMILAQSGFIGLIFYVLGVYRFFVRLTSLKEISKFYYCSALGAFGYLLVDSTAATAFVHPLSMPIASWVGILLSSLYRVSADNGNHNRELRKEKDAALSRCV